MIWLLVSTALAAPTLNITGTCPGTIRIAAEDGEVDTTFGLITGRSANGYTLSNATPCPGTTIGVSDRIALRGILDADSAGDVVLMIDVQAPACSAHAVAVDIGSCLATESVDMSTICADDDLDGVCDGVDICEGDDAYGDADLDGLCDDTDVCWGVDSTGDDDGDFVCNDADVCAGDDAFGDADLDGTCEDLDVCWGDDATGDDDRDLVCNDADLCAGDDAFGDADLDGVCENLDVCWGDDATGDDDGDLVCNDVDICDGDDAEGDSDSDGVCDDRDLCVGDDVYGDTDRDGICEDIDICDGDDALGDSDGDGSCNDTDLCEGDDTTGDADGDGFCADADICDAHANPNQDAELCTVWFVDDDATGESNGSSWSNAFPTVQAAVDAAAAGDSIWIATGTYGPAAANQIVVTMAPEVSLYGGFAGTESTFDERAGLTTSTILTGDFNGDDDGTADTMTDNAIVIYGADDTTFDGFVLASGYDDTDEGAGMRLIGADRVVVHDMIFRGNRQGSWYAGSAIGMASGADVVITDSLFIDNHGDNATVGGSTTSAVEIYNSTFVNNTGTRRGVELGIMRDSIVSGCSFYGASGGSSVVYGERLVVTNSIFYPSGIPALVEVDADDDPATWTHNAAPEDYSSYDSDNLILDHNPFELAASGQLFITSDIVRDFGDDAVADVDVPDWSSSTNNAPSLGADTGVVDLGAHYDPSQPYVLSFSYDRTVTWTTSDNVTSCDLDDDGTVYTGAASGRIVGPGGPYTLTCYAGDAEVTIGLSLDTDGDGVEVPADCDDGDATVYPGAPDAGIDGIDSDCDGVELCYVDRDGDGDGTTVTISSNDTTCSTEGVSLSNTDCDDNDGTRENLDLDDDGVTTCDADPDCDDTDDQIQPDAGEIQGDSIDQNCDGLEICYVDNDGDGDGVDVSHFVADITCSQTGNSLSNADCNDFDATLHNLDLDNDGITTCQGECDDSDGIAGYADDDDEPDQAGEDGNCDGVDGDADRSIFLDATNGSDSNTGLTTAQAVATLSTAYDLADAHDRDWILIAGDQNIGDVEFEEGVHLAGGYTPGSWARSSDMSVLLITSGPEGKALSGWDTTTEWHQIDIVGDDAAAGESAFALTLRNTQGLTLVDSLVTAGVAADGVDGAAGLDGQAGNDGDEGLEGGIWSDDPVCEIDEVDEYPYPGDGGATISCTTGWGGDGHWGGAGGAIGYGPGDNGHAGNDGFEYFGDASADGGDGGNDGDGHDGEEGVGNVHGSDGDDAGASMGELTWPNNGLVYTTADGEMGTPGRGGSGGGGGGGGAGSGFPCPIVGGSGGGGGGGGCGADEGLGGTGGQISVAVVLDNSSIILVRSTIVGGTGGDGGDGGAGGIGGAGGAGGDGGPSQSGVYAGGDGGNGGNGGDGGNGSGGGGGPSVGVYCVDAASAVSVDGESTVLAGTPGAGGAVPGSGTPGEDGAAIDISSDCTVE